jgi:CMP-N-acetylneuraminic acid synthetase
MKILCVIPARGGSKGVKKKNIRKLNNRPLIAYTIESTLSTKLFDDVIVSTDDNEIAEISKSYGAQVPFIRPSELAQDDSSSDQVILHLVFS